MIQVGQLVKSVMWNVCNVVVSNRQVIQVGQLVKMASLVDMLNLKMTLTHFRNEAHWRWWYCRSCVIVQCGDLIGGQPPLCRFPQTVAGPPKCLAGDPKLC
jgi:hypothetical protein